MIEIYEYCTKVIFFYSEWHVINYTFIFKEVRDYIICSRTKHLLVLIIKNIIFKKIGIEN